MISFSILFEAITPTLGNYIKSIARYGWTHDPDAKIEALKRIRQMVTRPDDVRFVERLLGMTSDYKNTGYLPKIEVPPPPPPPKTPINPVSKPHLEPPVEPSVPKIETPQLQIQPVEPIQPEPAIQKPIERPFDYIRNHIEKVNKLISFNRKNPSLSSVIDPVNGIMNGDETSHRLGTIADKIFLRNFFNNYDYNINHMNNDHVSIKNNTFTPTIGLKFRKGLSNLFGLKDPDSFFNPYEISIRPYDGIQIGSKVPEEIKGHEILGKYMGNQVDDTVKYFYSSPTSNAYVTVPATGEKIKFKPYMILDKLTPEERSKLEYFQRLREERPHSVPEFLKDDNTHTDFGEAMFGLSKENIGNTDYATYISRLQSRLEDAGLLKIVDDIRDSGGRDGFINEYIPKRKNVFPTNHTPKIEDYRYPRGDSRRYVDTIGNSPSDSIYLTSAYKEMSRRLPNDYPFMLRHIDHIRKNPEMVFDHSPEIRDIVLKSYDSSRRTIKELPLPQREIPKQVKYGLDPTTDPDALGKQEFLSNYMRYVPFKAYPPELKHAIGQLYQIDGTPAFNEMI